MSPECLPRRARTGIGLNGSCLLLVLPNNLIREYSEIKGTIASLLASGSVLEQIPDAHDVGEEAHVEAAPVVDVERVALPDHLAAPLARADTLKLAVGTDATEVFIHEQPAAAVRAAGKRRIPVRADAGERLALEALLERRLAGGQVEAVGERLVRCVAVEVRSAWFDISASSVCRHGLFGSAAGMQGS